MKEYKGRRNTEKSSLHLNFLFKTNSKKINPHEGVKELVFPISIFYLPCSFKTIKPITQQLDNYQPRLLGKSVKSVRQQLNTLISITTWHCNEKEKQAWAFFDNKDMCEKLSVSLNTIFSTYKSSIKASTRKTTDGNFLVKLDNIDRIQTRLLAVNEIYRKDLQALASSHKTQRLLMS